MKKQINIPGVIAVAEEFKRFLGEKTAKETGKIYQERYFTGSIEDLIERLQALDDSYVDGSVIVRRIVEN